MTERMERELVYLDYAANTPADERVLAAFLEAERRCFGNPNAAHAAGLQARACLARAAERIGAALGAEPGEVFFTSGATEANNTALLGLARAGAGRHILTTPLEHASVREPLEALRREGYEVEEAALTADGTVDLADLRAKLRPDTVLAAVTAVDSELGTLQPLEKISAALREFPGCRLHVDATQIVGKLPFSFRGMDTASFAPHKFYGLNGCGVLLKRRGLTLPPLILGGAGEQPLRGGTPAVGLAAAAAEALELALEEREARTGRVREYNRRLRAFLAQFPWVRINSPAGASPYLLNLSVRGVRGETVQRALDREGICVSVRSACARSGAPSQAVLALTGDRRLALSSWRISLSHLTTPAELDCFEAAFRRCYAAL